jgi:ABC-type nitrate/sulfonate/bicarbonate transport system ATPase subunit
MKTASEAPVKEPRSVEAAGGVEAGGLVRTYASRQGPLTGASRTVRALDGMSLRARPREVVAVVGPSGCGKTTLLELICGLQQPDAGTVRSDPAVLMPQQDLLLPWSSALDNAALPLRVRGARRGQAREVAREMLRELGLEGWEAAMPAELSGGMRQRVAFARTLLAGKPVLALDEPFASLDALTRQELQGWLAGALAREPRTVVLVTHDVEEAAVLADRVVVMSPRPGRTVADLPVLTPRPRGRTDPVVIGLRERVMRALGVEAP